MSSVVELVPQQTVPDTWALFGSCDDPPGFTVATCQPRTFLYTVGQMLFATAGKPLTADQGHEAQVTAEELLERGGVDFEDGWMVLCRGVPATVTFLLGKIGDLVADRDFAESSRAGAIKRLTEMTLRHNTLVASLKAAIGDAPLPEVNDAQA